MAFGLWPSPITPGSLAQGLRLSEVGWDSDGETLVWLEGRSDRGVLVCSPQGEAPRDLTPTLSVRARVGYGGGDFSVGQGQVYFVAQEGRVYRQSLKSGEAEAITPQFGHMASPTPSPDGQWIVFCHTYEDVDGLAIVDAEGHRWPQKLIYGQDFYMQPCWHPSGRQIAWISWNHPDMPWDHTMLKVASLDTGNNELPIATEQRTLVDKDDVSVLQPQFSPDGKSLAYISDESGWWNLCLYDIETDTHRALTNEPVEVGGPAWVQGVRYYGFSPNGRLIYYVRNEAGFDRLWVYDLDKEETRPSTVPLQAYDELSQIAVAPQTGQLAFIASTSAVDRRIVSIRPEGSTLRIHKRSSSEHVPTADLSQPQAVQWAADDGTPVHGLYYPPASSRFTGTGLPPAIIQIHGGPTSQASARYNAQAQFFATRGYAFLTVNYRGSTGYGKSYMALLRGQWGVLDVEDAVSGAQYLVDAGLADPERLVIIGGSAGGYTVLKALVDHPGFFKAALCLYGVSNMFTLAADTHKFETRYLDSMLGPLPEASNVYRERSPIFAADQIVDPISMFQGEIDRVVPKAQAETIAASLQRRGVPHEYHEYEGEGHGWRKSETIQEFYRTVEDFLKQYVIYA
jgi:dipeptidyl aminopeptidase/acylaminoacyl peptidase